MRQQKRFTSFMPLLGVGAVSKTCVDAAIDLCNETPGLPLSIIASRRQVDASQLGGGYSNGWSTEEFAQYILERRTGPFPWIARDHGGPWQGRNESELNWSEADARARTSFRVDIISGFEYVHVDTCRMRNRDFSLDTTIEKAFEYLEFIDGLATSHGQPCPLFEMGAEEQAETLNESDEGHSVLTEIRRRRSMGSAVLPDFVVIQTGMQVFNGKNVGNFRSLSNDDPSDLLSALKIKFSQCRQLQVTPKAHNADYLNTTQIRFAFEAGLTAMNIAPELGSLETRACLALFRSFGFSELADQFVTKAVASNLWQSWSNAPLTDEAKALLCGHYLFNDPEVRHWRSQLDREFQKGSLTLDQTLKAILKSRITDYIRALNLIPHPTTLTPEQRRSSL